MDTEDVRLAVYRSFAATGRPPSTTELVEHLADPPEDVAAALAQLAAARHLVLADDGTVVMAHPFSARPLGFSVMGTQTLWWGGCAWDSFALPHLLDSANPALIATRCPACTSPHVWDVGRDAPPAGTQVAHFLVPVARMWDDVVHTCANQRIFCGEHCVDAWQRQHQESGGYTMDLATLWRLASHWYDGRLERGYVRRDPAAAADYLREVGLTGPFWGL